MNDIVIKVENLGKKYIIGHQVERGGYTALRDVLMQNARTLWNKTKDLARGKPIIQGDTMEEVWALKDVSFEIHRGEAVGIIGRNGAGKSTLLKILSRITEPTTGRVTIKGRVASLLEVGTGFHPELSGRENIYLNGTILGMTRVEIKQKFDEIVAFAEIEKFLDTPVKRYSSGMYIRLAFAVAAHLEPEILVVDEVLAVGDAQFQKKCLGKMGEVAKGGRTVLFVSHNMAAISTLCEKAFLFTNGYLNKSGTTAQVVSVYLQAGSLKNGEIVWTGGIGDDFIRLYSVRILNCSNSVSTSFFSHEEFFIEFDHVREKSSDSIRMGFQLLASDGVVVLTSEDGDCDDLKYRKRGRYRTRVSMPANFLNNGTYYLTIGAHIPMQRIIFLEKECLSFVVERTGGVGGHVDDGRRGLIRPLLKWYDER
ncbi:MAG: ABC transporter ATP-binding protein [Proteobacteria bacterium]|nr:ABC transporter ATP-binding protein [Pseudomonadota bacterium]